jgi:hypothetical protein
MRAATRPELSSWVMEVPELFWLVVAGIAGLGFLLMPIFIFSPDHRNLFFVVAGLVLYPLLTVFSLRFYRVRRRERLANESPRRRAPWE